MLSRFLFKNLTLLPHSVSGIILNDRTTGFGQKHETILLNADWFLYPIQLTRNYFLLFWACENNSKGHISDFWRSILKCFKTVPWVVWYIAQMIYGLNYIDLIDGLKTILIELQNSEMCPKYLRARIWSDRLLDNRLIDDWIWCGLAQIARWSGEARTKSNRILYDRLKDDQIRNTATEES